MKINLKIKLVILFVISFVLTNANNRFYSFEKFDKSDGLAHNYVMSMAQDTSGYIWFATGDGVSKYDGFFFKNYKNDNDDSTSLADNVVRKIFVSKDGTIWLGTWKGLNQYNPLNDNFIRYSFGVEDGTGLNDNSVQDIAEDSEGRIWIATGSGGLNCLNRNSGKFTYYKHQTGNTNSLPGNTIYTIYIDDKDRIWCSVKNSGVTCISPHFNKYAHYSFNEIFPPGASKFMSKILQDKMGDMWFATGRGLVQGKLKNGALVNLKVHNMYRGEIISCNIGALSISDNEMYLGFGIDGLLHSNINEINFAKCYNFNADQQNFLVTEIMVAKDKSLWVGLKDKGIKKYAPYTAQFGLQRRITEIKGTLSENIVLSFKEDEKQNLWVGTQNGLNFWSNEDRSTGNNNFKTLRANINRDGSSLFNMINAIYEDKYGYYWIGTMPGVLFSHKKELYTSHELKESWFNVLPAKTNSVVWSITESEIGDIWLTTQNGVVKYFGRNKQGVPQNARHYYKNGGEGLLSNQVKSSYTDSDGRVWLGTMQGLNLVINDSMFKAYAKGYAIRSMFINEDIAWLGTEGDGLLHLNLINNKITKYTIKEGLSNNVVWSVIPDSDFRLWLSTNDGLNVFNTKDKSVTVFYEQHGLQNNEFKTGANAILKNGDLVFGGATGFNIFNPNSIIVDSTLPNVELRNIKISNKVVTPGQSVNGSVPVRVNVAHAAQVNLNHKHKVVTFEFSGIQFIAPTLCNYYYKLQGFDEEWMLADKNRSITYTNLDKGKYTLLLKSSSSHNITNNELYSINVNVSPPITKTTVAYIIYAVLAVLIAYTFLKIREKKARRENERLSHERDLLQTLMDSVPDKIFFKDQFSRFTRVNKSFAKEVGVESPDLVLGKTDYDFLPFEYARNMHETEQEILKTGVARFNLQEYRKENDGAESWHLSSKVPLYDKVGNPRGLVGISREVTQQKLYENQLMQAKKKAEESDNLKSAFLANMSHEIRTPMNAVLGFLELLDDPDSDEFSRKEYIKIINANSKSLLKLIDDIIDISIIEVGQIKLCPETVSINKIIHAIGREYVNKFKYLKNRELSFEYFNLKDYDYVVNTDAQRIRQILVNFLENAVKFTKNGAIILSAFEHDKGIKIKVSDTGIGIPEDMQKIIFERFRKLDAKKDVLYRGTGLGLFIAKRLAEMLNFEIGVESTTDKGSVFWINIPAEAIKRLSCEEFVLEAKKNQDFDWSGKKILLVEDEKSNIKFLEGILSKCKVKIVLAHDGFEALNIFHEQKDIDLILMDIKMPKLDGIEATKIIREFNTEIPIIAQTAFALKEEKQRIAEAGCTDYIPKPIDKIKLMQAIDKHLGKIRNIRNGK